MISAKLYGPIFYNLILIMTIGTALKLHFQYAGYSGSKVHSTLIKNQRQTWVLAIFLILFIGLRPVSGVFVDTVNYSIQYQRIQTDPFFDWTNTSDLLFGGLMFVCAQIMSVQGFFLIIELIYIGCSLLAIQRIFPNNIWAAFLMYVGSFSFYSYGTNGIRNGAATAIFFLALSYINRKRVLIILMIIAVGFHKSMLLPTVAVILSFVHNNSKSYMILWILAIPVSLVAGDWFNNFIGNFGFDDRLVYLTTEADESKFFSTGFRWDFLLYSSIPIIIAYYVIFKRKMTSVNYIILLNTYVISNSFWILVVTANFSNRFAYLSWFLYPVVLLYPFMHFNLWKNQYSKVAVVLFIHCTFTYFMWMIR